MQPFAYGVTYSNSKTSIIIDNYGSSTSLSPVAELKREIYIYLISTLIIINSSSMTCPKPMLHINSIRSGDWPHAVAVPH